MTPRTLAACCALPAVVLQGCAFVPQKNLRLEEAREVHYRAQADPHVTRHAAEELRSASFAMERAIAAWNTLDDPAVVDHLAYLAKQRIAISHEVAAQARLAAAGRTIDLAGLTSRGTEFAGVGLRKPYVHR